MKPDHSLGAGHGSDFQDLALDGTPASLSAVVQAIDGEGARSTPVHISIRIGGANDAPMLRGYSGTAPEDGPAVSVDLSGFGGDIDGDDDGASLTYRVAVEPDKGLALIAGSELVYSAEGFLDDLNTDETHLVQMSLVAEDRHGARSDEVTFSIRVIGANDAPTVADAEHRIDEDRLMSSLSLLDLGDDADAEDDATSLTYEIVQAPLRGGAFIAGTDLVFGTDGLFDHLSEGEDGVETIQVIATDSRGEASEAGIIRVIIEGVNDAPVLLDASASTRTREAVTIDLSPLASDVDSVHSARDLTFAVTTAPGDGEVTIENGVLTFTPWGDFDDLGPDERRDVVIGVVAKDPAGAVSREADITISVLNGQAPKGRDMIDGVEAAILSMDVYNRGDHRTVGGLDDVVGRWTLHTDSSLLFDGDRREQAETASFFAVSYASGGDRVVSYRGTDTNPAAEFVGDIATGWSVALGFDHLGPRLIYDFAVDRLLGDGTLIGSALEPVFALLDGYAAADWPAPSEWSDFIVNA
jgi:hypothetical protein